MRSDDRVDPGDAALQELLVSMATNTDDVLRRDTLLDAALTVPSLTEWPEESLDALKDTCRYIIGLARLSREVKRVEAKDGE